MNKLKTLRTENKFSCMKMAELLNISSVYYWQLENKKRNLSYSMAFKISSVFNLKPDDIFYEEFKSKN